MYSLTFSWKISVTILRVKQKITFKVKIIALFESFKVHVHKSRHKTLQINGQTFYPASLTSADTCPLLACSAIVAIPSTG